MLVLLFWLLSAAPQAGAPPIDRADGGAAAAPVPCKSVADCWLDADGNAIARPARYRRRKLPRGDCGAHLLWLRRQLTCEAGACVVTFVGDKC